MKKGWTPHQKAIKDAELGRRALAFGEEAETEVEHVLMFMRAEGVIDDFYRTERLGEEDKRGIDFVLFINWEPMPLQVKRSAGKDLQKIREHYRKYPCIPCVWVNPAPGALRGRIAYMIHKWLEGDFQDRRRLPLFLEDTDVPRQA